MSAVTRAGHDTEQPDHAPRKVTLRRLLMRLAPHRAALTGIVLLVLIAIGATLIAPRLLGQAVDSLIVDGDTARLGRLSLLVAGAYVVTWVAMAIYSRSMAAVSQQVMRGLRHDVFATLQTLSLAFFDRQPVGDLMSRTTNDVDAVDQLFSQNLVAVVRSVVTLVGVLVFMLALDWRLTIAGLLPLIPMQAATRWIGRRSGPLFRDHQRRVGGLNGLAEEQLAGQREIIAFTHHRVAVDEFAEANEGVRTTGRTAQGLATLVMPLSFAIGNLSVAMVAGVGGWLAVDGRSGVTVGVIAAFIAYAQRLGQPLGELGRTVPAVLSALAGAERIFAIIDERPTVADGPGAVGLAPVQGRVVFDKVDFSYVPGRPVLTDVCLTAEPGQMIGLVGPTGAGKSTIVNLLTRFYDLDAGAISIDGTDLTAVTQDSLRAQVGVVLQDTFLFSETVRENIRFGRVGASDDDVVQAAKLANADGFIRALPEGFDTILSEGATNLSLGQRQLLAIARTMIAQPQILVLDEATSSVDTRTEIAIQQALLRLMEGRTSFVIAHRLSTVRDADLILVVDEGRIVQRGSHDELVQAEGMYRDLYLAQFRGLAGTATTSTDIPES